MGCTVSAYIDNIYVNKEVVPATCLKEHLVQFVSKCKDPERLEDSTWALGLAVGMEHGELQWKRSSRSSQCRYMMNSILLV